MMLPVWVASPIAQWRHPDLPGRQAGEQIAAKLSRIHLGFQITQAEQGGLNKVGINCIRAFPGRGIRVWGARTLSSDPEWRYINVRRLFNFVSESIMEGTQWSVFEPNDEPLRAPVQALLDEQGEAPDGQVLPLRCQHVGAGGGAGAPDDPADHRERP